MVGVKIVEASFVVICACTAGRERPPSDCVGIANFELSSGCLKLVAVAEPVDIVSALGDCSRVLARIVWIVANGVSEEHAACSSRVETATLTRSSRASARLKFPGEHTAKHVRRALKGSSRRSGQNISVFRAELIDRVQRNEFQRVSCDAFANR